MYNRQQPPRLNYETSRLFKFTMGNAKTVSELSSAPSEVISANSDSTSYPSAADNAEELLKRTSWNSLSSGETANARDWDDFSQVDLELYPASKETIQMIQESLGLLSKQKTCLKTQTSLVQELFAFVAENSVKEKKSVTFADNLVTARHSLDGYYRIQMTRKIQQLDLVQDQSDSQDQGLRVHSMVSVDSVDSAVLEEMHEPTKVLRQKTSVQDIDAKSNDDKVKEKEISSRAFYKKLPPTPMEATLKATLNDNNIWVERDSLDEDSFSVSSGSVFTSDSDEVGQKKMVKLRRTKKFVKNMFVNSDNQVSEIKLNADLDTGYHSYYPKLHRMDEPYQKFKAPSPTFFPTISLRQSTDLESQYVPVTELSEGSASPKRSSSPLKMGFGIKVKQIFSRWF